MKSFMEKHVEGKQAGYARLVSLSNSEALDKYLVESYGYIGIEFEDSLVNFQKLPKNLKYSIRTANSKYFSEWDTRSKTINRRKSLIKGGTKDIYENDGGPYFSTLFLSIQKIIDQTFVEFVAPNKTIPEVNLKVGYSPTTCTF